MHNKSNILNQFNVVLCRTSHGGNIGSSARAMKTMGLSNLYLVQPKHFPSDDAYALAAGADDILDKAIIVGSAMASFTVEKIGIEKLIDLDKTQIEERINEFKNLVSFN